MPFQGEALSKPPAFLNWRRAGFCNRPVLGAPALLHARATDCLELRLDFLLALLQGLKPQLPAMKLDTDLIDITCDFDALRLVLFELML